MCVIIINFIGSVILVGIMHTQGEHLKIDPYMY